MPIKNMEAYNKTLERTKAYLSADDTVLEVGCGTGSTALLLAESVKQITAIDFSAKMIEIARGKAQDQAVENASFKQATLADESLEMGAFDVVLAYSFLHLLEDTPEGIRRVSDLLKPGGFFISKTVCMGGKSKLWAVLIYVMRKLGLAPYVRFLKVPELEDFVTEAGFEIIETGFYPASRPNRFIVARKV